MAGYMFLYIGNETVSVPVEMNDCCRYCGYHSEIVFAGYCGEGCREAAEEQDDKEG